MSDIVQDLLRNWKKLKARRKRWIYKVGLALLTAQSLSEIVLHASLTINLILAT